MAMMAARSSADSFLTGSSEYKEIARFLKLIKYNVILK